MGSLSAAAKGRERARFSAEGAGQDRRTRKEGEMATTDLWTYSEATIANTDLTGFKVEAVDGSIGKIDEASNEVGASYLVVDTAPWIFGKKVMLPAGVVDRTDHDQKRVFVDRTKDQIQNAPEFDERLSSDASYRDELGAYYGEGGAGWFDRKPSF
jgi:hypothetical protein